MDIAQTPPPAFGATNTPVAAQANESREGISSDFETFLRMLTVQLQNQDPLNPVESQDFAVQLATFSNVEQAVLTNDLLGDIGAQLSGNALQQMSGYVGMEVLARAPVAFSGEPITVRPDINPEADRADLVVRNATGEIVERRTIGLDATSAEWAGADDRGTPMPSGIYRFEIESFANDASIETKLASAYNRVEEARTEGGDITLTLSDGTEISSSLVNGLRAPGD